MNKLIDIDKKSDSDVSLIDNTQLIRLREILRGNKSQEVDTTTAIVLLSIVFDSTSSHYDVLDSIKRLRDAASKTYPTEWSSIPAICMIKNPSTQRPANGFKVVRSTGRGSKRIQAIDLRDFYRPTALAVLTNLTKHRDFYEIRELIEEREKNVKELLEIAKELNRESRTSHNTLVAQLKLTRIPMIRRDQQIVNAHMARKIRESKCMQDPLVVNKNSNTENNDEPIEEIDKEDGDRLKQIIVSKSGGGNDSYSTSEQITRIKNGGAVRIQEEKNDEAETIRNGVTPQNKSFGPKQVIDFSRIVKLKFPDFTNLTLAQVLTVINIHLKEKKLKARKAPLSYKYRFCLSEVVLEYLKYKGNTNI